MGVKLNDDFDLADTPAERASQVVVEIAVKISPTGDGAAQTIGPFIVNCGDQRDIRNVQRYQQIHQIVSETILASLGKAADACRERIDVLKTEALAARAKKKQP